MTNGWTVFLKGLRRKESVSRFILTMGLVDVAMGGVSAQGGLMAIGLTFVGIAGLLRLWAHYRRVIRQPVIPNPAPIRYLPETSSRPSLPVLGLSDRQD